MFPEASFAIGAQWLLLRRLFPRLRGSQQGALKARGKGAFGAWGTLEHPGALGALGAQGSQGGHAGHARRALSARHARNA